MQAFTRALSTNDGGVRCGPSGPEMTVELGAIVGVDSPEDGCASGADGVPLEQGCQYKSQ